MKRIFFILILFQQLVNGQNLVPNGSFEEYSNCPKTKGMINFSIGWFCPFYPIHSSTEYFNACSNSFPTPFVGVPQNDCGYQLARTGQAYIGIGCAIDNAWNGEYKEYAEIRLLEPLHANRRYIAGYYVSLSEISGWAIKNMGIYFSMDSVFYKKPIPPNIPTLSQYTAQVENQMGYLADTAHWVKVQGSFIAKGGEQFMVLGNFRSKAETDYVYAYTLNSPQAYYYIDDVFLYPADITIPKADAGNDITICKGDYVRIGAAPVKNCTYSWEPYFSVISQDSANSYVIPDTTTTYYLTMQDEYFNVTTDSITVRVIECNDDGSEVLLYPNPVIDRFSIRFNYLISSGITIKITNTLGQRVYERTTDEETNVFEFNTLNFASGLYDISFFESKNIIYNGKFVKRKE